jgi:hypothetical protein
METMQEDGSTRPAGGTLTAFEVPTGRGVRVETFGYAGYTTSPAFDSLLAKVIVHDDGAHLEPLLRRAERALAEFRIDGVPTNICAAACPAAHRRRARQRRLHPLPRRPHRHAGALAAGGGRCRNRRPGRAPARSGRAAAGPGRAGSPRPCRAPWSAWTSPPAMRCAAASGGRSWMP